MNKILILIPAFLLTIQFTNAQTNAGTQNAGLNLGISSNKTSNFDVNPFDNSTESYVNRINNFSAGPAYSFFIANQVDIGAALTYTSFTFSNSGNYANNTPKQSNTDIGGTIFIRKYFLYQNKIGIRTGVNLGYDQGIQKYTNISSESIFDTKSTTNNYQGGLNLDAVYYPSKKFGLSAALARLEYNSYKTNSRTRGYSSGDGIDFNFISNLQVSAFYIF